MSAETIECDLAICRLRQAATPAGDASPLRGDAFGEVDVIDGDVWIAVHQGVIVAVGPGHDVRPRLQLTDDAIVVDADGLVAVPGLVDCHTHACFGGDRVAEFELRASGASYEELHAAGGGILSTVTATRRSDQEALAEATRRHLTWMLEHGTTSVEIKSGYGLDVETEIRMLRAIATAEAYAAQRIHGTVLAAHAVPPEQTADEWIDLCRDALLPEAREWSLAQSVDVFVERGAYDADQARRYLEAAAALDFTLRLHGDQFSEMGAVPLAIELGARSVDHLEATGPAGVAALAASDTAAVLLPTAALQLGRPLPPARGLIDAGAIVALATDFNPGSSFCDSLPLVMGLACTQMHLSPGEALCAVTVNAAHVLGDGDRVGRLREGYLADIVLLEAPDWRYLAYHLGTDGVKHAFVAGQWALEG